MAKKSAPENSAPRSAKSFMFGGGADKRKFRRHISMHKIYPVVAGNPNAGENGLPKTLVVGETHRLHFSYSSARAVERAKINDAADSSYRGMISAHVPACIASGVHEHFEARGIEINESAILAIAHLCYRTLTRKDATIQYGADASGARQKSKIKTFEDVPTLPSTWMFRPHVATEIAEYVERDFEKISTSLSSFWKDVKKIKSSSKESDPDAAALEGEAGARKITFKQPNKLDEPTLHLVKYMKSRLLINPLASVLFGRMIPGSEDLSTIGAVSSSDDISVGPVRIKSNLSTTRDELGERRGSVDYLTMRGTASALMTSTRTINLDDLLKNLTNNIEIDTEDLPRLVGQTISCYTEVFAQSTPAGRQNTSDTRSTPALLVLEVSSMPTTADSAFYDAIDTGVSNISSEASSRLARYLSVEKEQWRTQQSAPSDIFYLDSTGAFIPEHTAGHAKIRFHRVNSLAEMTEIAARIAEQEAS